MWLFAGSISTTRAQCISISLFSVCAARRTQATLFHWEMTTRKCWPIFLWNQAVLVVLLASTAFLLHVVLTNFLTCQCSLLHCAVRSEHGEIEHCGSLKGGTNCRTLFTPNASVAQTCCSSQIPNSYREVGHSVSERPSSSFETRVDGLCQGRGKLLDFKRNHGLPWLAVHPSLLTLCSVTNQVLAHLIYWKKSTAYKHDLNLLPKEIDGKCRICTFMHSSRRSVSPHRTKQITMQVSKLEVLSRLPLTELSSGVGHLFAVASGVFTARQGEEPALRLLLSTCEVGSRTS